MRAMSKDEDGVALVTAILVSAVVLALSVSSVTLAIHNVSSSGYDKRRLQAIDAAEAGIDYYYSLLAANSYSALPGVTTASTCVATQTLTTTPSSTFTVTPTFYASNPDTGSPTGYHCPQTSPISTYVKLKSVGSLTAQTTPVRTMESKARLSPNGSGTIFPAAAIYGSTSVDMSSNVQLAGNGSNNANVYTNGNLTVKTASSIHGNLYVQGTATVSNGNFQLSGDLWANNAVTITGGKVGGAAISSTTTIAVSGNSNVYGGAKAGGLITVTPPANVYGTRSQSTSGISAPPSLTYPNYTFNAGDWPGYNAATDQFTGTGTTPCNNALTRFNNWTTGNLYIRLTSLGSTPCTLNVPAHTLTGNLGVISDGPITLSGKLTTSSGPFNVYLFAGLGAPTYSSPNCDFNTATNSGVGANLPTLIYTPSTCKATFASNSSIASGQIFSGTVKFSSNSNLTYAPVDLPGASSGSQGSLIDIVYKREIVS